MSGTLTVGGMAAGLLTGSKTIGPVTITGTSQVGQVNDVALASGANTVGVPAGAVAVMLVLPQSNTMVLQVKTSLDSGNGVSVAPSGFVVLTIPSGASSLTITSPGVGVTLELSFI